MKGTGKLIILAVIVAAVSAFFVLDLGQYLSLEALQERLGAFREYQSQNAVLTGAVYFAIYVLVTSLSLPGAALLTLLAGALFGLTVGTVLVSFASTLGATLAFLAARLILGDTVRKRFRKAFESIDRGMDKEGAFYLFTLRLIPIFPFFVINLVMGLTNIRVLTFALVSQLGMLPGTLAYVNAGKQLANLESVSDIASPALIGSFVILGLLPLIGRRIVEFVRGRRVYRGHKKPARFDHNMIVIGGGSGGLVTAYIAAAVKAKVLLITDSKMGGDCLYTGCVPSKSLLRSAKLAHDVENHRNFGFASAAAKPDFSEVMARVQQIIAAIEPHDSPERYESLGVQTQFGRARIVSPWEVEVQGQRITARSIVIATGGKPFVPPVEGIEDCNYVTSDSLWELEQQPDPLVILGGGPIGCEMAQAFARLGSQVTLVERGDRLLSKEDPDAAEVVADALSQDGVTLKLKHTALRVEGGDRLICEGPDGEIAVPFDRLLVAVGRRANTKDLGLEELGIETGRGGTVEVNEWLQTRFPNVYACGDVIGPYQFTHSASHEAWYCAVNALFGRFKKFRVDYSVLPWVTFTEPEVARVGLSETDAAAQGIEVRVTRYDLAGLDRALADGGARGFVKVLTPAGGSDRILGATVVGDHGSEILGEFTLAMRHGLGLKKIMGTVHPYPTWGEAAKFAAGRWTDATKPEKLMPWLARFHRWERS
ncbi:MAG: FAD-dependent oxidoreductase [Pseudomonadota bacterium]